MKKLIYVLYALLFLAATGFLIYDILVAKNFDSNSITKYLILVAGFVLSIVKLSVRPQREVLRKKQVYQNAYAEFIRNAFSNDKKRKVSFTAPFTTTISKNPISPSKSWKIFVKNVRTVTICMP